MDDPQAITTWLRDVVGAGPTLESWALNVTLRPVDEESRLQQGLPTTSLTWWLRPLSWGLNVDAGTSCSAVFRAGGGPVQVAPEVGDALLLQAALPGLDGVGDFIAYLEERFQIRFDRDRADLAGDVDDTGRAALRSWLKVTAEAMRASLGSQPRPLALPPTTAPTTSTTAPSLPKLPTLQVTGIGAPADASTYDAAAAGMPQIAVQKHPRYRLNAPVDIVTAAAEMEQTAAENISLGGMFIRTTSPPAMGTPVRLRLRAMSQQGEETIGLTGKVVHIVDASAAAARSLPMGVGIQFEGLPQKTEEVLARFVDNLAQHAQRERALLAPARFATPTLVQVKTPRVVLQTLWNQSLKHGGLFAEGDAAPLGTMVRVFIGALELSGEVVHLQPAHGSTPAGAGLQMRDLEGGKREALTRFLDGTVDVLFYRDTRFSSAPVAKVLAAARRLFLGIEENDPFGGIALPATATAEEVQARVEGLRRLFQQPPDDASPPQMARIEAALRALDKLEPVVLTRVADLRRQAEQATTQAAIRAPSRVFARGTVVDVDAVRALLFEAAEHERKGDRAAAKKALVKALELAPDDVVVQQRLTALDAALDLARALDLLGKAEVFIQGVGMKAQAITNANEAISISTQREVRLRAVRVLAKAGDLVAATNLAEELLEVDSRDQHALQALVILHEKSERWTDAARVGETLLRLKPDDTELQKRVKKIVENARRPPGTPSTRIPSGRWSLTK